MKKSTILLAALVALLIVATTGCDLLLGEKVTEEERVSAFLSDANASTRDYDDMRSHFHSTVSEYSTMNTEGWWQGTGAFAPADGTVSVTGLTSGGAVGGVPGTSSLAGTLTNDNLTDVPVTFGFLADESNPRSMLIRVILVDDGNVDTIRSIR